MARHADQVKLSEQGGAVLREAKELGFLTDANVAAADTVAGLKSAVQTAGTALTQHGELEPLIDKIQRAIQTLAEIGDLADALINPLTTVDGLIALTANVNTSYRAASLLQ